MIEATTAKELDVIADAASSSAGVKGLGQVSVVGVAAAIANAIHQVPHDR